MNPQQRKAWLEPHEEQLKIAEKFGFKFTPAIKLPAAPRRPVPGMPLIVKVRGWD